MMTFSNMTAADSTDAELVALSRAGNRDAFGQIVARYQSLICSLAYSATGCLGHSEDLAQETFITAWTSLCHLREPQKLRAWLCGIARNCINRFLRHEGREPAAAAQPLEVMPETLASEPLPPELAINREEEAILWRALERLPESYRGPLVLFYREGQSAEQKAVLLALSENAVRQRLTRGRKLLTDEVAAFVQSALKQTAPGRAFTLGVLASLPVFATTASAATGPV
jgi:RNA polymerase sigma factor (sigma-70 family)